MTKEQRDRITARWKLAMDYVLDGHNWHLRREPYSSAEYPISFAWVDTGLQVLGDPNSGIGAPLCGADSYAEFSGDWDTIEKYWDAIRKIPYYFYYCHDWTMMQTGCREHTADSCIDMDVIAYEGAAAFLRMARTLKKTDDIAAAKLLVARFGVSGVTKWWGPAYGHPGLKPEDYASIGCGYSEFSGYANKLPRHSDPCFINGEIALSFSWCGNFPSWYTLLLNGNGADFWRVFQYDMVENKMYQWRTAHPGHRNWHDANVAAHLYMRLLLGMSDEEIAHELELSDFFKNPYPRMAAENAAFYALLFSHDTPVVLNSYGQAELEEFRWDRETRTVTASFRVPENAADDVVSFDLKAVPVSGPEENVRLVPGIQTIQWLF